MGSHREIRLPYYGLWAQLVLSQSGKSESCQQRPPEVQQTSPFQPENYHPFPSHGCHDYRRDVNSKLFHVSLQFLLNKKDANLSVFIRYILFHPLAYLVKLNIEMTMANLIKRIAVSSSRKAGGDRARIANEFDFSNPSTSGQKSSTLHRTHARRSSLMELSNFGLKSASEREVTTQGVSFIHATDQIKVTKDIYIQSETMKSDLLGPAKENMQVERPEPGEISVVRSKSVDDLTEGGSVKSNYIQGKGDSDDETHLVSHQGKGPWYRLE